MERISRTFLVSLALMIGICMPARGDENGGVKARRAGSSSRTVAELIEKVEKRFEEISGFSAQFRQTFHNVQMGTVEESAGTVVMKKPLRMRWEYRSPEPQTIISDAKTMYYYLPTEKQVIVEPLNNVIDSRSPALFLAGGRKLREVFEITDGKKTSPEGGKFAGIPLQLEPREKSISVTRIIIYVDKGDFTIRGLSLFDWVGNRSDMEFSGMKINEEVDNTIFNFVRPDGVELIESPKL